MTDSLSQFNAFRQLETIALGLPYKAKFVLLTTAGIYAKGIIFFLRRRYDMKRSTFAFLVLERHAGGFEVSSRRALALPKK